MTDAHDLLDVDLPPSALWDLADTDALAAFFAQLGYRTEGRIEQTPGNLGIQADGTRRPIKSIQLLAEQEDGFQVYLFELSSVTVAHTQALARSFRNLDGIFLLVLTSDYERIDFVFLERYLPLAQEETLPGIPSQLFRHKLRPLVHTIQRRNPSRIDLRLLRRFTWTEADGYAQHDKIVNAYGIAHWSEELFNNRGLFSDYYLLTRLPERREWEEDPKPAYRELRRLYREAHARAGELGSREDLLSGFLGPVLTALGFMLQPSSRGPGKPKLTGDPARLPLYAPGDSAALAHCLLFPWGRSLDGKDEKRDKESADVNPGVVVVRLLEQGDVPWAILTNGRLWRLYARRAHSRATNYYEIDLGEVLDATGPLADPNESFRYFWLLFRRQALQLRPIQRAGQAQIESLLDELLAESESFAHELGESLKEKIFEDVFEDLAAGFAGDFGHQSATALTQADLDLVFRGTLTFLYRLLFLLYAEARDLLPVREVRGYYDASLSCLKKEIEAAAGAALVGSREKLNRHYKADSFELYQRLARLFQVIDQGDANLNVPFYNGGLFLSAPQEDDTTPEAEAARFLLRYRIPDAPLARAIDRMARDEESKGKKLIPIDYKSLGVRQLGSIYEGLLEFRLRVAREEMALVKGKKTAEVVPLREARPTRKILREGRGAGALEKILKPGAFYLENDKRERKASGSYYTPDFVVKYIVEKTVGPLLATKLEALRPMLRKAEAWHKQRVRFAEAKGERIAKYESGPAVEQEWGSLVHAAFDLKVLDPAMGSGHFLVEAVDFVTDKILEFLSRFPWNPVFAHLADLRKAILDEMERQGIVIDERKLTDVHLLKRHVLKRCIFGVDLNPMAVELAKVSLWLDCFTLGAPLSFLDHHLRCGNSLLGVTVQEVEDAVSRTLFGGHFTKLMLATQLMAKVGDMPDVTGYQMRESRQAFGAANHAIEPYVRILDIYLTRWLPGDKKKTRIVGGKEIDFLKAAEAKEFLLAGTEAEAKKIFARLPTSDREFARTALEKARGLSFLHWELGFPEVFYGPKPGTERVYERIENGGFDAVIGNPPWIRQEGLKEAKPALDAIFPEVYASEADIYAYFIARGGRVLRRGGRFGMILQNKWLKAEYAEKLRHYLAASQHLLELVNFGHAPLFDADTFPCILLFERPGTSDWLPSEEGVVNTFDVNRRDLPILDLAEYAGRRRNPVPLKRLRPEGWELLPKAVGDLMERIRSVGKSLKQFERVQPYRGIITGLNEAFLISQDVRDELIREDSGVEPIIKKFFRGENIERWHSPWEGEWIILLKSSHNHSWSWSKAARESEAEDKFCQEFPSLHARMKPLEARLRKRQDKGKFWWELRACDYYAVFERTKIVYQDIGYHSAFSLDRDSRLSNNTCYFIPSESATVLATLNSLLIWWFLGNVAQRGKDGAFRLHTIYMDRIPIPIASEAQEKTARDRTEIIIEKTRKVQEEEERLFGFLRSSRDETRVPPGLEGYWLMDEAGFMGTLRRRKMGAGALFDRQISQEFLESRALVRPLRKEVRRLEIELHHLVFDLYGLTPDEVRLIRETAPPRDPLTLAEQELALLEEP